MERRRYVQPLRASLRVSLRVWVRCALALSLWCALPAVAAQSSLSRWLSDEALPQLADVLGSHPRFAGQHVQLVPSSHSGLDEALLTVLLGNLGADKRISVGSILDSSRQDFSSIDALACGGEPDHATLSLTTGQMGDKRWRVSLELADTGLPDTVWRRWEWQGLLSREERDALARAMSGTMADGSLAAPWPEDSVVEAAGALGRDLACDLKPQVRDRLTLQWQAPVTALSPGQPLTDDVFNASRHLLGDLREIDMGSEGDFRVEVRVQRFQDDVLQLWLVGTPLQGGLDPVQAVTYVRSVGDVPNLRAAPSNTVASVMKKVRSTVPAPGTVARSPYPDDPARDFLDVQMIDASQSDNGFATADLAVQLQLVNRGEWPIEYAFSVSGGHYLNCVADPANFRFDRYGYVEGEVPPGESLTRAITVSDVQHKPNPWIGPRKCAGFKDLEGFENFSGKGYKVTEFLRWSM